MDDHELTELYGPAATHSEHQRGEHIRFTEEGRVYSGTIIWVCAPGEVAGRQLPTLYIVEGDHQQGFPHIVYPGDIIQAQ